MPVIHPAATAVHQMHGTSFTSYASPAHGSKELCPWRIEILGHTRGTPHHVSREEVLYILSGTNARHYRRAVRRGGRQAM